jgi:N-methylhydantoinase A
LTIRELPVFDFTALAAGQEIAGPAIVESDTTTVLLLAGDTARMDGHGWLAMVLPGD